MKNIQSNINENYFATKLLSYDASTAVLKEIEKYRTNWKIVDWFIKVYRYLFSNSNLHHVVKGMIKDIEKIDPKSTPFEYFTYIRIFKKNVIDKHNRHLSCFQTPIKTIDLDEKLRVLCEKLFADEKEISPVIVQKAREFFKTGELSVTKDNLTGLLELVDKYKCLALRNKVDEVLAGSPLVNCSKLVKEKDFHNFDRTYDDDYYDIKCQDHYNSVKNEVLEFLHFSNYIHTEGLEKSFKAIKQSLCCSNAREASKIFGQMETKTLDAFAQVAKIYTGSSLGDFCEQVFIDKFQSIRENLKDISLKKYFSDINYKNEWWESNTSYLIEKQFDIPSVFPIMRIFFEKAIQLDLQKASEIIFETIINQTATYALPTTINEHEKNKSKTSLKEMMNFVRNHLPVMHGKYPNNELISLAHKLFDSQSFSEEQSATLFIHGFSHYVVMKNYSEDRSNARDNFSIQMRFNSLSTEQMLDFHYSLEKFAKLANISIDLFNGYTKSGQVASRFEEEIKGIETQEKMIEKYLPLRNKFLQSLSFSECRGFSEWRLEELNDKFYINIEKTPFNKQLFQIDEHTSLHSDVTLILPNGDKLFLHKKILEVSPYFQKLLSSVNPSNEFKMDNINVEKQAAFVDLMASLYTHKHEINKNNHFYILQLADKYELEHLLPIRYSWQVNIHKIFIRNEWWNKDQPIIPINDCVKYMKIAKQFNLHPGEIIVPYVLDTFCRPRNKDDKIINDISERKAFLSDKSSYLTYYKGDITPETLSFVCDTFKELEILDCGNTLYWGCVGLNDGSANEISRLQKLVRLSFGHSVDISIKSLKNLLLKCPKIKSIEIRDYSTFKESHVEIAQFSVWLTIHRPDLEISEQSLKSNSKGALEGHMNIKFKSNSKES